MLVTSVRAEECIGGHLFPTPSVLMKTTFSGEGKGLAQSYAAS